MRLGSSQLWQQSWGKAMECVATAPCIPLPYGENSARNEELWLLWYLSGELLGLVWFAAFAV